MDKKEETSAADGPTRIGLYGLAVMGQNLALNIADHGFKISVCNRSPAKVDTCVARWEAELKDKETAAPLVGYKDVGEFVKSIQAPRNIIILVKAGKPVDATIAALLEHLEKGDMIIDGGNEWYENTERRSAECLEKGILYMGMGVSGGEDGARLGPSMMPGGSKEGFDRVADILKTCAAQVDGTPCVDYIGKGGSGNYVKMVHNGIEYGDMQLIAEAYDMLKIVCGHKNDAIAETFAKWNASELQSYLIEITADIFKKKDDLGNSSEYLVDKVLDKTGNKGTGMWTCREGALQSVPVPTINAALTARYLSALKDERVAASKVLEKPRKMLQITEIDSFVDDLKKALYAAKICSYAQGMALIKTMGEKQKWDLNLGAIATMWKGGCIIRAKFLNDIKAAFDADPNLANLLMNKKFGDKVNEAQAAWRKVLCVAIQCGIPTPAFSASLSYFDSYRRENLPANLTQAQRDYFGRHTFQRKDEVEGKYESGAWISANWQTPEEA